MPLSIHSILCAISSSVSTDWFFPSLRILFSYFFSCLVIFYWTPDSVNCPLIASRYFYIPIIFLGFILKCSELTWKQLTLLRLDFKLCETGPEKPLSRATFAPIPTWFTFEYSTSCPWITGFFSLWLVGTWTILGFV